MSGECNVSAIDYEKEGIQELWHRENHYICIYKLREDNEIVIESANQTYLELLKIGVNEIGKPLASDLVKQVKNLFQEHMRDRDNDELEYLREFDEIQGCTIWNVTSKLISNYLLCIGKKIHEYFVLPKQGPLDLSYPSLLVSLAGDGRYKIESYSKELEPHLEFSWLSSGYIFDTVDAASHIKASKLLDECLRINQTIQLTELISLSGTKYYAMITLIPIIHKDCSKILIIAKKTGKQNHFNSREDLEKFSREFGEYYHSQLLALCFVECTEDKNYKVTVSNACFQQILKQGDLTEELIIKSSLFKQCIQTRIAVRGNLKTKSSRELCTSHFIHIIPTINDNKVVRVFIAIDPTTQKINQASELLLKLTKREREILSYVADGYTNKYISSQLMITEGTVKRIVSNGYKKLDISSRIELAKLFMSDN